MKINNVPIRKCIGCGERKSKDNFIMVVRAPHKEGIYDFKILNGTDKKDGRGAYICNNLKCFLKAKKFRKLEKSFSSKIDANVYEKLERVIMKNE